MPSLIFCILLITPARSRLQTSEATAPGKVRSAGGSDCRPKPRSGGKQASVVGSAVWRSGRLKERLSSILFLFSSSSSGFTPTPFNEENSENDARLAGDAGDVSRRFRLDFGGCQSRRVLIASECQ